MESSAHNHQINNFYPHKVTGKIDDSFVGLRILGNEIHFYYPECYHFDVDSGDVREDIVDLLNTISIAKTKSHVFSHANNKNHNGADFALMSYLWVLKDYLLNGFYINREKIFRQNVSGRVNWKKTMQLQPIVSEGNIIYPNIIVEAKNSQDNILVEIHKFCVKKSIDFIGWLFNVSSKAIETKPFNASIKKVYLSTLKSELDRTFDDDKRLRLTHLVNVIQGLDTCENNNEFVYGVDSYYYVFERMIDSIFGNVKDLKDFNPKATWHLVRNNYAETKSSELRPDTVLLINDIAYILDSKFYRFGYTGDEADLPETTSIQKQITYGDYIKKNVTKVNIKEVFNAFLLPYDKELDVFKSEYNLQYIGYAKSMWKDNDQHHEKIHSFLIDLKHVVKTWNGYNHRDDIEKLIAEIDNHRDLHD